MKKQTIRTEEFKKDLCKRLNRIEGQVRGIKGMIENDTYCNDVLNQILAVKSALDSVNKIILESHIKSCLVQKIKDGEDEPLEELMAILKKITK